MKQIKGYFQVNHYLFEDSLLSPGTFFHKHPRDTQGLLIQRTTRYRTVHTCTLDRYPLRERERERWHGREWAQDTHKEEENFGTGHTCILAHSAKLCKRDGLHLNQSRTRLLAHNITKVPEPFLNRPLGGKPKGVVWHTVQDSSSLQNRVWRSWRTTE